MGSGVIRPAHVLSAGCDRHKNIYLLSIQEISAAGGSVPRLSLGEGSKRGRGMESPSGSTGPITLRGPASSAPRMC